MKGVPFNVPQLQEKFVAAGHPAADRITTTADLDVPVELSILIKSKCCWILLALTWVLHYTDPKKAPPGSALLWREEHMM